MAGEQQQDTEKDTGKDQAESLIDELIREILNDSRVSPESSARGNAPAALLETVFVSALADSRTSTLERFLLAEAFGSALADALAPAVADLLSPRLMKYLEQAMNSESAGKAPARAAHSGGPGRKPGS